MSDHTGTSSSTADDSHVIIAGFGIPGRFVAELLEFNGVRFTVIELNQAVVERCQNVRFVHGDVRDEAVLRKAGIEKATLLAITFPGDQIMQEAVKAAHKLRPDLKIVARADYTSAGMQALKLGAHNAVISEQLVAREFFRLMDGIISGRQTPEPATGCSESQL